MNKKQTLAVTVLTVLAGAWSVVKAITLVKEENEYQLKEMARKEHLSEDNEN